MLAALRVPAGPTTARQGHGHAARVSPTIRAKCSARRNTGPARRAARHSSPLGASGIGPHVSLGASASSHVAEYNVTHGVDRETRKTRNVHTGAWTVHTNHRTSTFEMPNSVVFRSCSLFRLALGLAGLSGNSNAFDSLNPHCDGNGRTLDNGSAVAFFVGFDRLLRNVHDPE